MHSLMLEQHPSLGRIIGVKTLPAALFLTFFVEWRCRPCNMHSLMARATPVPRKDYRGENSACNSGRDFYEQRG
jgi:hypothetical protein